MESQESLELIRISVCRCMQVGIKMEVQSIGRCQSASKVERLHRNLIFGAYRLSKYVKVDFGRIPYICRDPYVK